MVFRVGPRGISATCLILKLTPASGATALGSATGPTYRSTTYDVL